MWSQSQAPKMIKIGVCVYYFSHAALLISLLAVLSHHVKSSRLRLQMTFQLSRIHESQSHSYNSQQWTKVAVVVDIGLNVI